MKKMVVMSLLTLSMVAGSFSYVCAASLNHTSEIAVQSAADNTDTPQIENQTTNADEKANEMMKSIENTLSSSLDDISSDSTTDTSEVMNSFIESLKLDSTERIIPVYDISFIQEYLF